MTKFNVIIVIYNQVLDDIDLITKRFSCISKYYLVDNSTDQRIKKANFSKASLSNNFIYIDMNGNKGLSKAYNAVIENLDDDSWILVCDQDTTFTDDNIKHYVLNIEKHSDCDVLFPIVYDSIGIMSPSICRGLNYIRCKNEETTFNKENLSFINSGMMIKSIILKHCKYDENLFLDYVDHDFNKNYSGLKKKICSDIKLEQQFSGTTKNSFNTDMVRFKIFMKDTLYFGNKWGFRNSSIKLKILKRVLKLTLCHRTLKFMNIYKELY